MKQVWRMCIVLACWIYRMRGVLVHERPMGHMAPRVSVSSVVTYTPHVTTAVSTRCGLRVRRGAWACAAGRNSDGALFYPKNGPQHGLSQF